MAKKKSFLDAAGDAETLSGLQPTVSRTVLNERNRGIEDSQKVVSTKQMLVDPEECVIWESHNRIWDRLTEENCRDLLDGMIAAGRQTEAALVRPIKKKGPGRFEIIFGARRFWCVKWLREHNYPEFQYLVQIEDLTDEEAFRRGDQENRTGKDISAYERGLEFAKALKSYYASQSEMADRTRVSEAKISRYIALSKVPVEIVNAYAELNQLTLVQGPKIVSAMKVKTKANAMLQEASRIHAHQHALRADNKPLLSGPEVFKRLMDSISNKKQRSKPAPLETYGNASSPVLTLTNKNQSCLLIQVPLGVDKSEAMQAFSSCLDTHGSKSGA
ncbi:MAG: ParB/RepB/Spo0J family partition protein [Pseudomonadales bacterium]|nr:ParB/RepB/Spo0J family partition protein [Pseudomonadales bacterium]